MDRNAKGESIHSPLNQVGERPEEDARNGTTRAATKKLFTVKLSGRKGLKKKREDEGRDGTDY